jgi:hypothetical protein
MIHFKNKNNCIFAYDQEDIDNGWVAKGLTQITDAEADIIRTPTLTQLEIDANRKATILSRLSAIDIESIRPLRAASNGTSSTLDVDKLSTLDAEADVLRAELSSLI